MAVIFTSIIKSNPVGRWYIELTDTSEEDSVEFCLDMEEYARKIEEMAAEYGPDVEVQWSADKDVSQEQINEVRMAIAQYEAKQKESENTQDDGGFNPNG